MLRLTELPVSSIPNNFTLETFFNRNMFKINLKKHKINSFRHRMPPPKTLANGLTLPKYALTTDTILSPTNLPLSTVVANHEQRPCTNFHGEHNAQNYSRAFANFGPQHATLAPTLSTFYIMISR